MGPPAREAWRSISNPLAPLDAVSIRQLRPFDHTGQDQPVWLNCRPQLIHAGRLILTDSMRRGWVFPIWDSPVFQTGG